MQAIELETIIDNRHEIHLQLPRKHGREKRA